MLRIEEETEMMRTELLRKEKELLELKKKDIDQQLQGLKMQQQIKNNSVSYVWVIVCQIGDTALLRRVFDEGKLKRKFSPLSETFPHKIESGIILLSDPDPRH